MKKPLIYFLSVIFCTFIFSMSFQNTNKYFSKEGFPPCDSSAGVGAVSHPTIDGAVLFFVSSSIYDSSFTYEWEITRQNGTKVYVTGHNPAVMSNCAYGYRFVSWKVKISKNNMSCGPHTLQGGQSTGICSN